MWQAILDAVKSFVQTEFFGPLASGVFGAFFGAWGAQAVITRGQRREAFVAELNAIRSAQMLCFSIINRFLALKKQHVRRIRDDYMKLRQAHESFVLLSKTHSGPQTLIFHLKADLMTLSPVRVPTELLEQFVFEKISVQGRALAAAADLIGAIDGLNQSITLRNDLIAEIREQSPVPPDRLAAVYLGIEVGWRA